MNLVKPGGANFVESLTKRHLDWSVARLILLRPKLL